MKSKVFTLLAMLTITSTALADPYGRHYGYNHDRDHHEWHERGGHFGWGEFVGGLILGGLIVHEVNGHYYDNDEQEVRQVNICENIPLFDMYGRVIHYYLRCHREWVQVYP
jgi:hypothetical protein